MLCNMNQVSVLLAFARFRDTWKQPEYDRTIRTKSPEIRINRVYTITVSNRKAQTARAFRARSRINEPAGAG